MAIIMGESEAVHALSYYENQPDGKVPGPVYGVIIDATCRYFKPHNSKYMATLKIIDHSWNRSQFPPAFTPFVKVVFISARKEDVPNIKCVGDTLRLHGFASRRICEARGNTLMLTRDGSSGQCRWQVLGAGVPMEVAEGEETHVQKVKEFAVRYFEEQCFVDNIVSLSLGKGKGEFDAIVKLTRTKTLTEESKQRVFEMKVLDHTEKGRIRVAYQTVVEDFPRFAQSCLLLIKAAKYKSERDNVLELKEYGNVLVIPSKCLVVSKFLESLNYYIEWSRVEDRIQLENTEKSFLVSQVAYPYLPITQLPAVFSSPQQLKHRVRVYVIDIGPKNIKNWVKGYCATCDMSFGLGEDSSDTRPKCDLCSSEGEVIFQVQLFVKDHGMRDDEDIYKLLLYTHNGKGSEFFDQEPPTNLYRDRRLCRKLKGIYKVLTTYGVYLDCVIERLNSDLNSYFQIVDTVVGCDCIQEIAS